jgi:hypothetical protein
MIRAMAELVGWLKSAIEPSEIFGESYRNLEGNCKGEGGQQTDYTIRFKLPSTTSDLTQKKTWSSGRL